MRRALKLLPPLALTAYLAAGESSGYFLPLMRWLCLGLALALLPAGRMALRRGWWSDIHLTLAAYPLLNGLIWWGAPGLAAGLSRSGAATGLYLLLGLAVSLPRLWGRSPFTTFFARQSTPQAFWDTDIFRVINSRMTWVWTGLFAVCAAVAALPALFPAALGGPGARILLTTIAPMVLMLGLGLPFNRWYPAHHQRRLGITPVGGAAVSAEPTPPAAAPAPAPSPKEETMSQRPVVAALNASPHAGIGNTAQMIEMLRPALEAEGLELKHIHLADKEVNYCVGCGFCMERGACWIEDDHKAVVKELLDADAVILGSPVYFYHVTGQMKTFLDRSLAYGHKPRGSWKPGLALSVTARVGETEVAEYLGKMLKVYGAYPVGAFTALATKPGEFLGKETVQARAADLARDLARAVKEKRRYPVTSADYFYWLFMRELVTANRDDIMRDDFEHWQKKGLANSFEAYAQQEYTRVDIDDSVRQAWIRQMIAER
ncbi:MAG: flavodoxin family protein, partial [Pseudomonadota bacterium]